MSPRRTRRRDRPETGAGAGAGSGGRLDRVETWPDGEWVVRPVTGSASAKTYRCPGCDHEIRPATPHLVTWPADGRLDERRHWHRACWQARTRRRFGR